MRLNPELHQALASLRVSTLDVTAARAAYLPDLGLNFTYGIDAVQFAVNGREGVKNLGYSAGATLDIPVWDWLSTQHRVRQSEILRDAAHTALTATQRRLIAQLDEFYAEAGTSRDQLQSLEQSVQTAAESLRLTRLRYTAGRSDGTRGGRRAKLLDRGGDRTRGRNDPLSDGSHQSATADRSDLSHDHCKNSGLPRAMFSPRQDVGHAGAPSFALCKGWDTRPSA
jgi:hypothetical protein